MDKAKRK
jgi:hypothetical protein